MIPLYRKKWKSAAFTAGH